MRPAENQNITVLAGDVIGGVRESALAVGVYACSFVSVVKSGPRQLLLKPKAPASLFPGLKGWKRRELAGIVCDD